jgi:hypothetical protein
MHNARTHDWRRRIGEGELGEVPPSRLEGEGGGPRGESGGRGPRAPPHAVRVSASCRAREQCAVRGE